MIDIEHNRWVNAIDRVAKIERKSDLLKPRLFPREFRYAQRSAWSTSAGYKSLPQDQQPQDTALGKVRTRLGAESLLIGKFDVDTEVRLRAFYPEPGLSIRYQTGGKTNGITRTVSAHKKVHRYAPELMPTVHEDGTILDGRGAFLIEDTVEGETATRSDLETLLVPLTQQLHAVHEGVGVTDKKQAQC